jgi:LysM repeat protein
MASTVLSSSRKPLVHMRVSLRKPLRCGLTVLMCSCLLAGAAQCRARSPQDVAEAAREERARKDAQKKSEHVYTDEDLRRAKILTPEDEARAAANRQPQIPPIEEQAQAPAASNGDIAQLPLGDIARRYRDAKRAAQTPDPFHLPFDEPVFAAPVISAPNLAAPRPSFSPVHPNFLPARPHSAVAPVLPSPAPSNGLDPSISLPKLGRPTISYSPAHPNLAPVHPDSVVAPAIPSPAPLRRVDPFTRRLAPTAPSSVSRPAPVIPRPKPAPAIEPSAPKSNSVAATTPAAPQPNVASAFAPLSTAIEHSPSRHIVTVQPGDSLWKLAQQNLGRGSRWQELLAANPDIVDPSRLAAGTEIVLPSDITGMKSDVKVTVQPGDTLSKIARVTYGHGAAWRCIAQANPEIADVNRIYAGQQLLLPFSCER